MASSAASPPLNTHYYLTTTTTTFVIPKAGLLSNEQNDLSALLCSAFPSKKISSAAAKTKTLALSFYSEFLMIFFRIMLFLRLTNRFTTIRNIISYEKLFS